MIKEYCYAVYRMLYLLIMYTGIRGIANRIIAKKYGSLPEELEQFHNTTIRIEKLGLYHSSIYHRKKLPCGQVIFMLSLQMHKAPINFFVYKFFCLTSHFGKGHIESAFCFKDGKATFFAFRNIAKSNARRLYMKNTAKLLRVSKHNEMYEIALVFLNLLEESNIPTDLEKPEKVIDLAIDHRLLKAKNAQKAHIAIDKNYRALIKRRERFLAQSKTI